MLNTLSIRWLDGSYNEGIIMKLFVTPISEAVPTEFHGQKIWDNTQIVLISVQFTNSKRINRRGDIDLA